MIFFVKNFLRSVFRHLKVNLIILFDLIFCASVVFVLLQNFYFLKEKHDEFFYDDRVAQNYYLSTGIDRVQTIENDVWNKTNMYEQGLKIYREINSGELALYTYQVQYLNLQGFDSSTLRKLQNISGSEEDSQSYQMIYISDYGAKGMNLKLNEGRWFTEEDYNNLKDVEYFPVIMGSEYKGKFNLGDIFYYNDGEGEDKAVVVGFLDSNQIVEAYGMVQEDFDNSILAPLSLDFPRTNIDEDMLNRMRVRMLGEGILYSPDDSLDVQKYINQLTSKYGYYTIEASPVDGTAFSETKSLSERNILLIGILALLTTIICTISLGGILYNRTLDDRRTFCIFMSAGIPVWKINLSLIIEMVFWIILSIAPIVLISMHEFDAVLIPVWQIVLFELVVIGISIAPSLYLNSKCNIDLLIRNQMI
ncbi:MAG: hypothetical protein MJ172_06690 [Clostridia bacterium]|nr:hypothetical protein [Clostridia bacterium]